MVYAIGQTVICDIVIAALALTAGDQRATDQSMNNARSLANYKNARKGYQSCMCPMCNGTPSLRRHAKAAWNRAVRRSEQAQINDQINEENNHDDYAKFLGYRIGLNLQSYDNLRSVNWDF